MKNDKAIERIEKKLFKNARKNCHDQKTNPMSKEVLKMLDRDMDYIDQELTKAREEAYKAGQKSITCMRVENKGRLKPTTSRNP